MTDRPTDRPTDLFMPLSLSDKTQVPACVDGGGREPPRLDAPAAAGEGPEVRRAGQGSHRARRGLLDWRLCRRRHAQPPQGLEEAPNEHTHPLQFLNQF